MANKDISIRFKAEDKATSSINGISGNINKFANNVKNATKPLENFGKSLKNLGSIGLGLGTIKVGFDAITNGIKNAVVQLTEFEKSWSEIDKSIKSLDFAAKINDNLEVTSRELQDFASELEKSLNYTFAGGDLLKAINTLSFDKTGDQIKKILPLATDLSAALGVDLQTAVNQLNGTFSGTIGQLGKMFPELKTLSAESLQAGGAIDVLQSKLAGVAEELSNTVSGTMLASETLKGNLKEELGYWVSDFFEPIQKEINKIRQSWIEALSYRRTVKQAKESAQSGKATIEDYQVLFNEAQNKLANAEAEKTRLETNRKSLIAQGRGNVTDATIDAAIEAYTRQMSEANREMSKYTIQISKLKNEEEKRKAEKAEKNKNSDIVQSIDNSADKITEGVSENQTVAYDSLGQMLAAQEEGRLRMQTLADQQLREALERRLNAITSVFDSFGEVGQLVNMFINGSGWIGALLQMVSALNSAATAQSEMYSRFTSVFSTLAEESVPYFIDALDRFVKPFVDSFKPLAGILGSSINLITAISNSMLGWINSTLTGLLVNISGALSSFLSMFAAAFTLVAEMSSMLTTIMNALGLLVPAINLINTFLDKAFTSVEFFFDALINVIIKMYNMLASTFRFSSMSYVSSHNGKYVTFDNLGSQLKSLWENWNWEEIILGTSSESSGISNSYSDSSSSLAHYTPQKNYTINIIYDHSFVNGDEMEIALQLRDAMQRAEKLGY